MQRTAVSAVLLLSTVISPEAYAQQAPALTTTTIAARATPATVTIVTFDAAGDTIGQGSGFVIRSTGTIVTNWHVLQGAHSAVVILATGERYERVLYIDGDSSRDVALVQVPGSGLPSLPTRDEIPAPGSKVVVIGSPLGLARTVAEGIVSATRMVDGQEFVQVSAPISHGSSGGPVLDDNGRVFAIATAMISEGQQLNFAVPVRYASGLLSLHSVPQSLATAPTATAATSVGSNASASASNFWTPPRAPTPKSTLSGSFWVYRDATYSTPGNAQQRFTGWDLLEVMENGHGLMGVNCDSTGVCGTVYYMRGSTAPSGDIVLDPDAGYAYDGYQSEDGFIAHTKSNGSTESFESFLRGWYKPLPLSYHAGIYSCRTRTQYKERTYAGEFTEWWGSAAALESKDTVYLELSLANSDGGTTGGYLVARRSGETLSFQSDGPHRKHLTGRWLAGSIVGTWVDDRDKGSRFEGTLTCNRQ